MNNKGYILFALLLITILPAGAQQWKWETIKPGEYGIGYKTIIIKTFSRPYSASPVSPRVLPIHIWYPAQATAKVKMKFIDYVRSEKNPYRKKQTAETILQNPVKQYVDSAALVKVTKQLADISTGSVENAIPRKGKFPVVLMGNGLTTPGFFYTLMAEFLASHGYVVISFPSIPENETTQFEFTARGIFNQLADMELVVNEMTKLPFADKDNMALAAWSVGGAAHILFQMKHKTAKAIISMDAASQYQYGKELITGSVYYDSATFTTPFLNLTAAGPVRFVVPRSIFFADTLAVNKQQFTYPNLTHSNFLSFHQYILWLTKPDPVVKKSYEEMCERIKEFLDMQLVKNKS